MDSFIKDKSSNKSQTVLFDDSCYHNLDKPLSVKRVEELEKTLGKALLERFNNEILAGNLGVKK